MSPASRTSSTRRPTGASRLACCLVLGWSSALAAQSVESKAWEPRAWQEPQEPEADEEDGPRLEAELAASTIFQGGTVAVRSRSPLTVEAHFFGVADNEIGTVGLAWTFSRNGLRVIPGIAWSFGSKNRPAPVVTARWSYEHARWLTQGLWVQSLKAYVPEQVVEDGESEEEVLYASILDGIHVSARVGRAELGPLVEYVRYREEQEWKGGARVAWRVAEGFKLVGQLLVPEVEARAGFVWER